MQTEETTLQTTHHRPSVARTMCDLSFGSSPSVNTNKNNNLVPHDGRQSSYIAEPIRTKPLRKVNRNHYCCCYYHYHHHHHLQSSASKPDSAHSYSILLPSVIRNKEKQKKGDYHIDHFGPPLAGPPLLSAGRMDLSAGNANVINMFQCKPQPARCINLIIKTNRPSSTKSRTITTTVLATLALILLLASNGCYAIRRHHHDRTKHARASRHSGNEPTSLDASNAEQTSLVLSTESGFERSLETKKTTSVGPGDGTAKDEQFEMIVDPTQQAFHAAEARPPRNASLPGTRQHSDINDLLCPKQSQNNVRAANELTLEDRKILQELNQFYRMPKILLERAFITNSSLVQEQQQQQQQQQPKQQQQQQNESDGDKLELPAPENVTVLIISWYPPILKLSWTITDLDSDAASKLDFYDSFSGGSGIKSQQQSHTTTTNNSSGSDVAKDEPKDKYTKSSIALDLWKLASSASKDAPKMDDVGLEEEQEQLLLRQFERRKQLLKKALTCFQITYNIINSRFKVTEEFPTYLRTIQLERLQPATEYSLRVVAVYLDGHAGARPSQRVHFISPADNESRRFKENTYRPIHRYPDEEAKQPKRIGLAQVRSEELTIVLIAILFWIATICLFFNKWGKIRMLEPYQPAYRETVSGSPASASGPGASPAALAHHPSTANLHQLAAAAAAAAAAAQASVQQLGGGGVGGLLSNQESQSQAGSELESSSAANKETVSIICPTYGSICAGEHLCSASSLHYHHYHQRQSGSGPLPSKRADSQAGLTSRRTSTMLASSMALDQALTGGNNSLIMATNTAAPPPQPQTTATITNPASRPHLKRLATSELNYIFQTKASALAKASLMWPSFSNAASHPHPHPHPHLHQPLAASSTAGAGLARHQQRLKQEQYRSRFGSAMSQQAAHSATPGDFETLRRMGKCLAARRRFVAAGQSLGSSLLDGGKQGAGSALSPLMSSMRGGSIVDSPGSTHLNPSYEQLESSEQQHQPGEGPLMEGAHAQLAQRVLRDLQNRQVDFASQQSRARRLLTQSLEHRSHYAAHQAAPSTSSINNNNNNQQERVVVGQSLYRESEAERAQLRQNSSASQGDESKFMSSRSEGARRRSVGRLTTNEEDQTGGSPNKLRRLQFMSKLHQHHHLAHSTSSSTLVLGPAQSSLGSSGGVNQKTPPPPTTTTTSTSAASEAKTAASNYEENKQSLTASSGSSQSRVCDSSTTTGPINNSLSLDSGGPEGGQPASSNQTELSSSLQQDKLARRASNSNDNNSSRQTSLNSNDELPLVVSKSILARKVPTSKQQQQQQQQHHILIEPPSPPTTTTSSEGSRLAALSLVEQKKTATTTASNADKHQTRPTGGHCHGSSVAPKTIRHQQSLVSVTGQQQWDKSSACSIEGELGVFGYESGRQRPASAEPPLPPASSQAGPTKSSSSGEMFTQGQRRRPEIFLQLEDDGESCPEAGSLASEDETRAQTLSEDVFAKLASSCRASAERRRLAQARSLAALPCECSVLDALGLDKCPQNSAIYASPGSKRQQLCQTCQLRVLQVSNVSPRHRSFCCGADAAAMLMKASSPSSANCSLANLDLGRGRAPVRRVSAFCGSHAAVAGQQHQVVSSGSMLLQLHPATSITPGAAITTTPTAAAEGPSAGLCQFCGCTSCAREQQHCIMLKQHHQQLALEQLQATGFQPDQVAAAAAAEQQQSSSMMSPNRPRICSVFAGLPAYNRSHRDSFAMFRALSQKKSKSAEDIAYLSSLVLQIWTRERNPLLQSASQLQHRNQHPQQQPTASGSLSVCLPRRQSGSNSSIRRFTLATGSAQATPKTGPTLTVDNNNSSGSKL